MEKKPIFFIAIGFLGKDSAPEVEYTAALALQSSMQKEGRDVYILGDGKSPITTEDINREVGKLSGPVELMLVGHGDHVPAGAIKDQRFQNLDGQYVMTIGSGIMPDSTTPVENIGGVDIPFTAFSSIQDIFKAVPANVVSVTVAACKSERALEHTNLLPEGVLLYTSAGADDLQSAKEMYWAMLNTKDRNKNGNIADDLFATYVGTEFGRKYSDNLTEQREIPSSIGISGMGVIDLNKDNLTATSSMADFVSDARSNTNDVGLKETAEERLNIAAKSYALAELVSSMDKSLLKGLAGLTTGNLEVTQNTYSEKPNAVGQGMGGGM